MYEDIVTTFRANAVDVERLVNFDREVLQVVMQSLEDLHSRLKSHHASPQMNGGRVLEIVKSIRNTDSLRSKYGAIFNQAVVLLVSHFASTLGDIFRTAVIASLENGGNEVLLDEEIKLTYRDMKDRDWNLKPVAADLLIAKKDFTFQDMGSTVRAFDNYVGIVLKRDEVTNNIILGQAARHVIVHAGALVTERMVKQISKATPRTLKPEVVLGTQVQFTAEEVVSLKDDMLEYILRITNAIEARQ